MSFEATQKSAEAFRTISEVAAELDLPQHVLRFWESRFPHVHPLKRAGNRRYYRPDDVDLLRGIAKLLYAEGLTIRGVQKVLREQGVRYVADLGRGTVDFMTPLKRTRLMSDIDTPQFALGQLARLHLEFAQPAEAIEPIALPADGSEDDAPTIHLFPSRGGRTRKLTPVQRSRLEELLTELLELKARLTAAKLVCSAAA